MSGRLFCRPIINYIIDLSGINGTDKNIGCKSWAAKGRCKTEKWVKSNCVKSCKIFEICGAEALQPPRKFVCALAWPTNVQNLMIFQTIDRSIYPKMGPVNNFIRFHRFIILYVTGVQCIDRGRECKTWADEGRCKLKSWVNDNCLLSCGRFDICVMRSPGKLVLRTCQKKPYFVKKTYN